MVYGDTISVFQATSVDVDAITYNHAITLCDLKLCFILYSVKLHPHKVTLK